MTDEPNARLEDTITIDGVIEDFATTEISLPRISMRWALDHWDVAEPRFLDLLARYAAGTERSEETKAALLFVIRLLAEKAATGAFQDLCRLVREPHSVPFLSTDAIASTLGQMLVSTFDGDAALLRSLAEDTGLDEWARHSAITAIGYLTRIGRIPKDATHDWLRCTATAMQPRENNFVWSGWAECVTTLGFADLAPDARLLFEQGLIGDTPEEFSEFEALLRHALENPNLVTDWSIKQVGPYTGAIEEMASWFEVTDDGLDLDDDAPGGSGSPRAWIHGGGDRNPWRHVGRNDPCPCGSGKKFKKCCLGKPEDERPVPLGARYD